MFNKKTLKFFPFASLVIVAIAIITVSMAKMNSNSEIIYGIYDPDHQYDEQTTIAIQHIYLDWNIKDVTTIKRQLDNIVLIGRVPMLTIEPYAYGYDEKSISTLFKDILNGIYNPNIDSICKTVADSNVSEIYVRWGHEMDINQSRYPWSQNNPNGYINSYKYFVSRCKEFLPEALYVWSPSGDSLATKYWPGSNYVDIVGLSLYSYKEWELVNDIVPQAFEQIFGSKYKRLNVYKRPIMISEFGVVATDQNKTQWLKDAKLSFYKYPLLKYIVFFNSQDHDGVWGSDVETPNWHIESSDLNMLIGN